MSLCIAAGGKIIALAATTFSLSWTHSVERTLWQEQWIVREGKLAITQATVQGSGAGIGLPDNAVRSEDGWSYTPDLPPLERLSLAASGATPSAWTLCADGQCLELGAAAGDTVVLWADGQCRTP
ncbi:DUF1850 domain-containing protein [Pelagibacterium sp. H642]|uniref:DUF1850 domain-containing protein n=1 Tax=Pelagibacterium sp. H642 TaxID=1881069 RepID=UPI0028168A07|nr:DUF1850 domain-containing protein [Pelagibacterium sp. H642]WMT89832.1 DUF1850 domain-containing protein [Pelagibacterium sp. H642]